MDIIKLENWYQKNHRDLPFRKTSDPYQIWVSEIMLQQTQMDTVIPYFNKFIKAYPTILELANTDEESLFHLIQGLGYYRRFKNMHKAAKMIVEDFKGVFPDQYKDLLKLPGVGEYSAGAIMSIAYKKAYHATDGNVIRVLSRFYGIDLDMRQEKNKKIIKNLNQNLIEKARPHIYTQALMELGALICRPNQAKCHVCPLKVDCLAYKENKQDLLPLMTRNEKKKTINYKVFMIIEGEYIYLRKRTERLLGGMYEYPQYPIDSDPPFEFQVIEEKGIYKHVFTHLIWQMKVVRVLLKSKPLDTWTRIKENQLLDYPMATAHKKIK